MLWNFPPRSTTLAWSFELRREARAQPMVGWAASQRTSVLSERWSLRRTGAVVLDSVARYATSAWNLPWPPLIRSFRRVTGHSRLVWYRSVLGPVDRDTPFVWISTGA